MRDLLLTFVLCRPVQSKVEMSQNFVAFSEYMNFTMLLDCSQVTFASKVGKYLHTRPRISAIWGFPCLIFLMFFIDFILVLSKSYQNSLELVLSFIIVQHLYFRAHQGLWSTHRGKAHCTGHKLQRKCSKVQVSFLS